VKILVAPDKFKGSLTAVEVCLAVEHFFKGKQNYAVTKLPLADGGEGTFEVLLEYFEGTVQHAIVFDPLMREISATYGISKDRSTAFIEMAKASGLQLLKPEERNPSHTTTFGTGQLILDALSKDVKRIILGIGGSATNDAGVGMATALGFRFFDQSGNNIAVGGGKDLITISKIGTADVDPRLKQVTFITLCDVTNPLCGPTGAAYVFSAQKGADEKTVRELDRGLQNFANVLANQFGFMTNFEGAGAAGGLGAGALFFLNSEITKGMNFISEITHLKNKIFFSDIVITGEGKLDQQSLSGKVVQQVCEHAKNHNKKVIVICGVSEVDSDVLHELGIDECIQLSEGIDHKDAVKNAFELIQKRLATSVVLNQLR
jgi:glycerate kinase